MIYLYVKTHNITGLKYFGKTTRKDPYKYKGSGIYWKKHLKKYGNNFHTVIIGIFDNETECEKVALDFSNKNNIVNSEQWANLKEENGLDGSPKGLKFSDSHKEKIRQSRLGKCYNDFDVETRQKMSEASKRKIQKQIENGTHLFSGETGSIFAKENNKRKIKNGTHNFVGNVIVVDKLGKRIIISKDEFWSQTGDKKNWKYVQHTSKEAKQRLKTAKEI
jgi:hypothetical protein